MRHLNTFKAHSQTPKRFRVNENKVQIILTGEWSTTGFACHFTGVWEKRHVCKAGNRARCRRIGPTFFAAAMAKTLAGSLSLLSSLMMQS